MFFTSVQTSRATPQRSCGIAALALLVLVPLARAQSTSQPAARPRIATTRLAGEENPKRTLTRYAVAMAAGDADTVADCYHADTPEQKAVVAAYVHLARSVATLRKAATDKYGPDGFDNIGFAKPFADQIKQIQGTRVFVQGPQALAFTDARDNKADLKLMRDESGAWKIATVSFTNPVRQAARIDAQATAYDELAAEIADNKYRLATDAQVAGRNKVAAAMRAANERLQAATRASSTRPAPAEAAGTK